MYTQKMRTLLGSIAIVSLLFAPAMVSAQTVTITSADIQRLQDDLFQASSELSRLRNTDPDAAARLQIELDDMRDEVIYLKVRLRKEGSVPRAHYLEVRDHLDTWRATVRGDVNVTGAGRVTGRGGAGTSSRTGNIPITGRGGAGGADARISGGTTDDRGVTVQSGSSAIPAGQEIDVRLQTQLSSGNAEVEDRFEATTMVDLYRGNEVLIPAGSVLRGVVRTVDRATRTDRKATLTVSFDQITVRGRNYPMRGTVTQALESEGMRGEAGRIGAGAGVGGIIGGIIGGVRGALLGILIGGGGTIIATEGREVTLPPGTILRVRLDTPPDVR